MPNRVRAESSPCGAGNSVPKIAGLGETFAVTTMALAFLNVSPKPAIFGTRIPAPPWRAVQHERGSHVLRPARDASPGRSVASGAGGTMPNRVRADSSPCGAGNSVPKIAGLGETFAVTTMALAFLNVSCFRRWVSCGPVVRMSTAPAVSACSSFRPVRPDAVASRMSESRRNKPCAWVNFKAVK